MSAPVTAVPRTLLCVHVLLAASLLLWPLPAMLGLALHDAPRVRDDRAAQLFLVVLLACPLPVLAGGIGFWMRRRVAPLRQLLGWTALACTGPLALLVAWAAVRG